MPLPLINIVADYGAVAGEDCMAAFQSACDAALAEKSAAVIYVPAAIEPYYISSPILCDAANVVIRGDGPNQSILKANYCNSILQFGVPRSPSNTPIPLTSWVEANGILDNSTSGKYGLRTFGDSWISLNTSPFALGPPSSFWGGVQSLTIDFCVLNNLSSWTVQSQWAFFGLMEYEKPTPFYCWSDGTWVYLSFITSDGIFRRARLRLPANAPLLLRCSIQVNLASGSISGWINHIQVAVDLTYIGNGWGVGLALAPNQTSAFLIGGVGNAATDPFEYVGGLGCDLTFFGVKLSAIPLYVNNSIGTSQARLDNRTITDALQFMTDEGASLTIAYLPLTDSGNSYRRIPWRGCGITGFGLWITANDGVQNTISGNSLDSLGLQIGNGDPSTGYGQAVAFGYCYQLDIKNCSFFGGAHGLGALNFGSTYHTHLRDCSFSYNQDAGYYGFEDIIDGFNIDFFYPSRTAVRHKGSSCGWYGVFVAPPTTLVAAAMLHGSDGTTEAELIKWLVDIEGSGNTAPSWAYVWAEAARSGAILRMSNFSAGTLPASADFVRLSSYPLGNTQQVSNVTVEDIRANGGGRSVICGDSATAWKGLLRGAYPSWLQPIYSIGSGMPAIVVGA